MRVISLSNNNNNNYQKAWDGPVASVAQSDLLSRAESSIDQARLLSACAEHSGDWLHAPPSQPWDCDSMMRWFGYLSRQGLKQESVNPIRVPAAKKWTQGDFMVYLAGKVQPDI